jgi:hypothetical protein
MAEIIVKNNLNPHKAVNFGVSVVKFTTDSHDKYYIEVGTTHSGVYDGENTYSGIDYVRIRPKYIDAVSGTLDEMFSDVIGSISEYIDWGPLSNDTDSPYISTMYPVGDDIPIHSNVMFTINDDIPTTGINIDDMKVEIDIGDTVFDITGDIQVEGNPFEYSVMWVPPMRVLNREEYNV